MVCPVPACGQKFSSLKAFGDHILSHCHPKDQPSRLDGVPPHGDEEPELADIKESSDAPIPSQRARKMVPHESCGYDCQGLGIQSNTDKVNFDSVQDQILSNGNLIAWADNINNSISAEMDSTNIYKLCAGLELPSLNRPVGVKKQVSAESTFQAVTTFSQCQE